MKWIIVYCTNEIWHVCTVRCEIYHKMCNFDDLKLKLLYTVIEVIIIIGFHWKNKYIIFHETFQYSEWFLIVVPIKKFEFYKFQHFSYFYH